MFQSPGIRVRYRGIFSGELKNQVLNLGLIVRILSVGWTFKSAFVTSAITVRPPDFLITTRSSRPRTYAIWTDAEPVSVEKWAHVATKECVVAFRKCVCVCPCVEPRPSLGTAHARADPCSLPQPLLCWNVATALTENIRRAVWTPAASSHDIHSITYFAIVQPASIPCRTVVDALYESQ